MIIEKIGSKTGIEIGDNVWIGANCSIVAGVRIGDNVTIGAGCTVRKDIPSNSFVIQSDDCLSITKKKHINGIVLKKNYCNVIFFY